MTVMLRLSLPPSFGKRYQVFFLGVALLGCICCLGGKPVWSAPVQTPHVRVELLSEVRGVQAGQPFWVAFSFQIRPGWHTYWQNPGDSGAPPKISWQLPPGFQAGPLQFPYPQRIPFDPLMNFGYEKETFLLVEITPPSQLDRQSPLTLKAKGDWLVCEKECIPESGNFTLTLPITTQTPYRARSLEFTAMREQLPQKVSGIARWRRETSAYYLEVDLPTDKEATVQKAAFFPFQDGTIENAASQPFTIAGNTLTLQLEPGYRTDIAALEGVVVVAQRQGTQAYGVTALAKKSTSPLSQESSFAFGQTLGLALLGGIILNFMPCVFPVLSLKALRIVQQPQEGVQLNSLVYTGGILTSFALLGGSLLGLRAAGQQVGWGFQLQSPAFVLFLLYILFAVGLNLSGVFVIGASWMGLGQGLTQKSGWLGEFFTGVLTTIVATPCSAPFMATAIGAALSQPWPLALAILLTLGLGLATPHLLLSFIPPLRRCLPKPGAWMETLQQFLAFPIYGAAAWLLWVLAQQTGTEGLAIGLGGCILIAWAAWLYGKTQTAGHLWRRIGTIGALAICTLAFTLVTWVDSVPTSIGKEKSSVWETYSSARLRELLESRKPVFVNFTASWCVSCLVNERTTLGQPAVQASLQSRGVVLLKADWTNRNPEITQALAQFQRSGVPLYVLYPDRKEDSKAVVLPHLLSPAIVEAYLQQVPNL